MVAPPAAPPILALFFFPLTQIIGLGTPTQPGGPGDLGESVCPEQSCLLLLAGLAVGNGHLGWVRYVLHVQHTPGARPLRV